VVSSSTATSPLHDSGKVRIGCHDVDHLADALHCAGLECDMTDFNRLLASITRSGCVAIFRDLLLPTPEDKEGHLVDYTVEVRSHAVL
jgi:hypothetical protein